MLSLPSIDCCICSFEQKISYMTYAYTALVYNEFDGNIFFAADGAAVPGSSLIPPQVTNGLSSECQMG